MHASFPKPPWLVWLLTGFLLATSWLTGSALQAAPRHLPQFTSSSPAHWINSEPLTKEALQGKVVLVEVWTSV